MQDVMAEIWAPLSQLALVYTTEQTVELCDLIGEWSQIARGYSVGHGATPDQLTQVTAREAVTTMANSLVPSLHDSPGLRARLRHHVAPILEIPEEDSFLRSVFDTRDPGENWRSGQAARETAILDAAPRGLSGPREWCTLLRMLKDEMAHTSQLQWVNAVSVLLKAKADLATDPSGWVQAIVEHELVDDARGVLEDGLDGGLIPVEVVAEYAHNERLRPLVVTHGVRSRIDDPYAELAMNLIQPEDASLIELEVLREDASSEFLLSLLKGGSTHLRVATAAAIVSGTREGASIEGALLVPVAEALERLTLPVPYRLHFHSTFIGSLRDHAPQVYREKLMEAAISYRREHKLGAFPLCQAGCESFHDR